jgi:hypothetical protein
LTSPAGGPLPFWTALYNAGADVVIGGHHHNYERFAPQNPAGQSDPSFGLREFVVGTGGQNLASFRGTMANSQFRNSSVYGVLKLTLHATSYDWQFMPIAGQSLSESGTGSCHGAPGSATQTAAAAATALQVQDANLVNDRRRRPH